MAAFLTPLAIIGTLMQMGGGMASASAARTAGINQRIAADYKARQLEQNATQQIAASQRRAGEERRRAQLVASRALAVAGASGAGVSDPSVANLLADLEGEGAYRAGVAMYDAEEQARQMRMGAATSRYEGAIAEAGGRSRARGVAS